MFDVGIYKSVIYTILNLIAKPLTCVMDMLRFKSISFYVPAGCRYAVIATGRRALRLLSSIQKVENHISMRDGTVVRL